MLRVEVNGQEVDLQWDGKRDWKVLIDGIRSDLGGRGWSLQEVVVDGEKIVDPDNAEIDLEDGLEHHVAIVADPTAKGLQQLHNDLVNTLPRFKEAFANLGGEFGKGEWRTALESLDPLLEELRWVARGFEMLKTWERQGKSSVPELAPLLTELSASVERQSWVEVSDLLLYELGPLLETWETVANSSSVEE